jgi:hypothetical protein
MFRHDTMQEHLKKITRLMNVFAVFGTRKEKKAFGSSLMKSEQNACLPEPASEIHMNS